jgi:hypothetical protein
MVTAAERFEAGLADRNTYLDRARTAASLTVPYLLPDSNDPGAGRTDTHVLPWNGIGAKGVLNLMSKLSLALLPATELFFRLTLDEAQVQQGGGLAPEDREAIEQALVVLEQQLLRGIEASGDRLVLQEALLHLLVVGNVLFYCGEDGSRLFHLNRYVCFRGPMGHPVDAVTCEELPYNQLSKAVLDLVSEDSEYSSDEDGHDEQKTCRIYTWIKWGLKQVTWHQEVKGRLIPGSKGRSPADLCPWMPLRMSRVDGQAYSPGYVETACISDLNTAESLSQAVVECAQIMAIVRFLVRPGGTTNAKTLAEAANGDFCPGDANDVQALQVQKAAELQAVMAALQQVEQRLQQSMLLANPRASERTTAEEIRLMAMELDAGLGSIHAILTDEWQRPYVRRRLHIETKRGGMPLLGKDIVQPVITTGLNALGRGTEVEKISRFLQIVGPVPGAIEAINLDSLLQQLANGLGVKTQGLIKSAQQKAAEQQQAQAMAMAQQAMTSPMADPQKLAQAQAIQAQLQQGQLPPAAGPAEGMPAESAELPPELPPEL